MDAELAAEGVIEDDTFNVDQNNDDYSSFEAERCGICMDIVIDRGVLDCCQHWFCFTCIDNWASITNLCPLCQNDFQSITCVPVYDTIGSSSADGDLFSREDDWNIEGANNTLSFPSYYIDENAVICLDGDGCKVRNGSLMVEEDLNLDTSIACDSCDIWYHAFCVGFDTEGTCENSWLCPRCIANENPQRSDVIPASRSSQHFRTLNASGECLVEAAFSGKVSVSIADAGETAVVVSMVESNEDMQGSSEMEYVERTQITKGQSEEVLSTARIGEDYKTVMLNSSSNANFPKLETPSPMSNRTQPLIPEVASFSFPCISSEQSELKTISADVPIKEPNGFKGCVIPSRKLVAEPCSTNEPCDSSLDLHLGLSESSSLTAEVHTAGDVEKTSSSEHLLPSGNVAPDVKDNNFGIISTKRKLRDYGDDVHTVSGEKETKSKVAIRASRKKVRADRTSPMINLKDTAVGSASNESQKSNLVKKNDGSDIMSIVQGTNSRRGNAAGLRVKKIMRRPAEDKESSVLVQKLRKEIREAVRNKSELGENHFNPDLLAAFRAAVSGSVTEPANSSPALVVKAKKLMLQKGKVRENLTKKIYGFGGRRKRAWTRDCEIEFWKHRCLQAGRPEKIDTLKSVLDLLRKSSDGTEIKQGTEGKATTSILSRLYLADTSVFPRKDDIKPLSDISESGTVDNGLSSANKLGNPSLGNHNPKNQLMNKVLPQSSTSTNVKSEAASSKEQAKKCLEGPSMSSSSGSKVIPEKESVGKSADVKKDKRKWALEILARRTAATGSNATKEKQEDNAAFKRNYPLLAQLPIDMRPVLAPSRHNKIAISVRQAQLYCLTEHFLRKVNLPVIRRTADTELAVADAVNIEKEVAEKSKSKLVYVNLMSSEILHRSDNTKSTRPTEPVPDLTSISGGRSEEIADELSNDPSVEEALKNAGLLSDSPPSSPSHQINKNDDGNERLKEIEEDEPDNLLKMDSHPELDIYGDFEYNLGDEDFIGANSIKVWNPQEEDSKIKVVFSTLNLDKSNNDLDLEGHECDTVKTTTSSGVADVKEGISHQNPPTDQGDADLSLAECEELYGPDKEPLAKRFPENEKLEFSGSSQTVKVSKFESKICSEDVVPTSGGEIVPTCSQAGENVPTEEKVSDTHTKRRCDSFSSISKTVEAYIKEHIRPLCKSGVITVEQYKWAVRKTTEKVMKYHSKEKNANFLIKEGDKVKKLAEQYVEAAQHNEKK